MTETSDETPIDPEAWKNADPAIHALKDSSGCIWDILENLGEVPIGHALIIQEPGHHSERFIMTHVYGGNHIVEGEEYGIWVGFNDPKAELVKKKELSSSAA